MPAALQAMVRTDHLTRLEHSYGKAGFDTLRMFMRSVPNPPDAVAFPETEEDIVAGARLVRPDRRQGDPLWRRLVGGEGHRARCRLRQGRDDLDAPHGQGAGGRCGEPGRAHPGRHLRARHRGRAARHAVHHAPLHAGLSLLDPGRLDRHALGRPLRHALHPHRRFRGEHAGRDAGRHAGDAPPARLRRRPQPRPHVHRLRGHSGHHHRGLGAAAQEADLPRLRQRALPDFYAGADAVRDITQAGPLSRQLPPARGARGAARHPVEQRGGRAGAGLRIAPTIRSTPG